MFQFSFKNNIDSLLAAAGGFIIIFLFTRHGGIGIEPDSVVYITAAENLHGHGRLSDFMGKAVVEFPAFYPVFLNVAMLLTGLKPLVIAPVLNALLFACLIYLSGHIMGRFLYPSKWYKIAMLTCIGISPCLLEVYSMVWSETVFLIELLLFIIALARYFETYSRKALVIAASIASLAAVTRYAGITMIAIGGILVLLDMNRAWRQKFGDIILYALISPLLLVINLVRNHAVGGTVTGNREISVTSLGENLHDVGSVFCDWLPFFNGNYHASTAVAIIVISGLAFICLRHFLQKRRLAGYEIISAFFSLFYIVFMIVTASISRFETLNSRFLSPVFIPLLWCGSRWIIPLIRKQALPVKRGTLILGVLLWLCFQYGQLAADYETWDGVKDAGIPGYTEDQWRYSATVLFIQNDSLPFQKGYTIYSDANDALYFFTGRPGKFLPHKEYKPGVQEFLNDPLCYVVWFDDGANPDLVNKDFITHVKKMKLLKQFDDGAIYGF